MTSDSIKGEKTILIIDDDQDCILLFEKILTHYGFKVLSAKTGQEGFALFNKESPDAILLDISLPDISGIDVASSLRKTVKASFPIIALTGYSQEIVLNKYPEAEALFTGFYQKTDPYKKMIELLQKYLS